MTRPLRVHVAIKIFLQTISFIFILALISCGDDSGSGNNNGDNPVPDPVIYMWVSNSSSGGSLGGADDICKTDGPSVNFKTPVSTHRAVIAEDTQDPRTFFTDNTPVKRPDGTDIAPRYGDFFDPNKPAVNSVGDGSNHYWTGMNRAGIVDESCTNWIYGGEDSAGYIGLESATDFKRFSRYREDCNYNTTRLLCISY